jgi:hypothetical protein
MGIDLTSDGFTPHLDPAMGLYVAWEYVLLIAGSFEGVIYKTFVFKRLFNPLRFGTRKVTRLISSSIHFVIIDLQILS